MDKTTSVGSSTAQRASHPAPSHIMEVQKGSEKGYNEKSSQSPLGSGVASFGTPALTGLWVRTPFTTEGQEVEIFSPESGKAVLATAGPQSDIIQMSLASFQALAVSPADLVPVEIRTP
jgi:hypothetical protein